MLVTGKCHCGNVSFRLEFEGETSGIPVRVCTCSFCVKHGGAWTSNPLATLEVTVRDPSQIAKYQFGTNTAEFHICTTCGVVPLVTSQIDNQTFSVVNVNTFENVDLSSLPRAARSFEGEQVDDRLERRRRNWIPDVRFSHQRA
jgi:hypothetical protein